jgi:NAD(P)-dependent dehydrogenase (short-subunit alcohol dehydrogenase family)
LPPLPTFAPLPRIKPLSPMPSLPVDDDHATEPVAPPRPQADDDRAATTPPAPPPPAGHPASKHPAADHVPADRPPADHPGSDHPTADRPVASSGADASTGMTAPPGTGDSAALRVLGQVATTHPLAPIGTEIPGQRPLPSDTPGMEVAASTAARPAGRHASVPSRDHDDALPLAPGLRVLVIGGAEPLGIMVTERLVSAGHRLAVHGATIPAELPEPAERGPLFRAFEPIPLTGDRADAEEMVHTVARAEVALGGLDALVMLPARSGGGVGLDADAPTWADEWSLALTTEVLAASCATHIAARSFLARRRAGRIILVTNGRDGPQSGAMPVAATRAAIGRLGADLTRELGPHGIGVSVVSTGPGGAADFAVAQVADVVEALLATPVLSGVVSQIG